MPILNKRRRSSAARTTKLTALQLCNCKLDAKASETGGTLSTVHPTES